MKQILAVELLVVCSLVACSRESNGPSQNANTQTQSKPNPVKRGKTPVVVSSAQLKGVLSAKIGFPPALAGLSFSQTKTDVQGLFPALVGSGRMPLAGLEGGEVRVGFNKENSVLRYVQLAVPKSSTAGVTAAWGKGIGARRGGGRTSTWWIDPTEKLQAVLTDRGDAAVLEILPLLPWPALLGGAQLEFAGENLLGLTAETVMLATAMRPRRHKNGIELRLAPTETQTRPTVIRLTLKADRVVEVRFNIDHGARKAAAAEIEALLKAKLGAPTTEDKVSRSWAGSPTVKVTRTPQTKRLAVSLTPGKVSEKK